MTGFLRELVYAARTLGRSRGFTATAVIALGLGIGANSAIFSVLDSVLLRPLPYADADRLVFVWEDCSYIGFARNTPAPANYADWRQENQVFTDMAAIRFTGSTLTGRGGRPEALRGRKVTANFWDVLGVKAALGRTFTAEEDRNGARVVLITDSLWKRRFGGDAAIVGREITLDGENRTVIGILPPGVRFPNGTEDFYAPVNFSAKDLANRKSHFLQVVARMKPGVTLEQARTNMSTIAARLAQAYPESNKQIGSVVIPLRDQLAGQTGPALKVLLAASGFVLLIACTNIANLMLARGWARRREYAVRTALGAGRWSLLSPMVAEAALCAASGAALGLALAAGLLRVLQRVVPNSLVDAAPVQLNFRVMVFTFAIAAVATLVAGLVPALRAARADSFDDLRQGGRAVGQHSTARRALVVVEVSLALVLLAGAGLMIESLQRLQSLDLGFTPEHILTAITPQAGPAYKEDVRRREYYRSVIEQLRALPGVESAAFASNLPFTSIGNTYSFRLEGRPDPPAGNTQDALYREVTTGYLETMQARLKEGRFLESRDSAEAPKVVVINETFARTYWPARSPLGQRLTTQAGAANPTWWTIVGVVRDMRERGYQLESKPAFYFADTQVERPDSFYLAVRTRNDPMSIATVMRSAVWAADREMPIVEVMTMEDRVDLDVADRKRQMAVLAVFAGLALLLAAIGIYGVLAFLVTQRTREIGVRMALGATRGGVVALVARQGGVLVGAGIVIGTGLALLATRALQSMLYGVSASDPRTYLAVVCGLGLLGVLASVVPAWRASRIDPVVALRDE